MADRPSPLHPGRRRFLSGSLRAAGLVGTGALSAGALFSACADEGAEAPTASETTTAAAATRDPSGPPAELVSALAAPGSRALIDEATFRRRITEHLAFATENLEPSNVNSITAHLVRAHHEPDHPWNTGALTVSELQDVWDHFDNWKDTRDFRLMHLLRMLALASGGRGAQHAERSKQPILDWAGERARFGFFERHTHRGTYVASRGRTCMWRVPDISLAAAERYRMFEATGMAPLQVLVDPNGGDPVRSKAWLQARHRCPGRPSTSGPACTSTSQPAWDDTVDPLLWTVLQYRDVTHACFPQDHFDEVTRPGHRVIGRKGDGYIALWSWRERVAAPEPAVDRTADGFEIRWASPPSGDIEFGSTGDFTVDGEARHLADFPRHASRLGTVDRLATAYELTSDRGRRRLDFDQQTRTLIRRPCRRHRSCHPVRPALRAAHQIKDPP